jgi:hypothetical protein
MRDDPENKPSLGPGRSSLNSKEKSEKRPAAKKAQLSTRQAPVTLRTGDAQPLYFCFPVKRFRRLDNCLPDNHRNTTQYLCSEEKVPHFSGFVRNFERKSAK